MKKVMMLAAMLAMMLVFAAPALADTATSVTGDATIDNSVTTRTLTVDTDINSNFTQGQFVGGDLIIGEDGSNTVVNQSVFFFGHPFFFYY